MFSKKSFMSCKVNKGRNEYLSLFPNLCVKEEKKLLRSEPLALLVNFFVKLPLHIYYLTNLKKNIKTQVVTVLISCFKNSFRTNVWLDPDLNQ